MAGTSAALHPGMPFDSGMPDVEMLTRKLEKGKAGLADLCQLYRASSKLPAIAGTLTNHDGPHAQLLSAR